MNATSADLQAVPAWFAELATRLEALLELLRDEQRALIERDYERVRALALAKNDQLSALGSFDIAQYAALRQSSSAAWTRLQRLAQEARRINHVNGALIGAQMSFVDGALTALQRRGAMSVFYGADGQKLAALTRHSLATA